MVSPTEPEKGNDGSARPSSRKWLRWVLVASLSLNLLIAGFVATHFLWGKHKGGYGSRGGGSAYARILPRSFFREMDRDRRRELWSVMRESGGEFRQRRRKVGKIALDLAAILESEPYDSARVDEVLEEYGQTVTLLIGDGQTLTKGILAKLTTAERKELARHIRKRAERARKRRERRRQRRLERQKSQSGQ